jgi:exonuclease SbcC
MIQEILLENVKGITTEQTLTGADILVGNNGTGKTARIQAFNLAFLGYIPGIKKDMNEIMKIASDKIMKVGLKSPGFEFSRTFTENVKITRTGEKDITYSQSIELKPPLEEKTQADSEKRIKDELGTFPVMLDFDEFIGLSDAGKRDFLYSFIDPESAWDKEGLKAYLETQLLSEALAENAPDRYENMSSLINELISDINFVDINSAVDALVSILKDKKKYWEAEYKKATGATQKLGELKNALATSDRNIQVHKKELEELQQEFGKVNSEFAQAENQNRNYYNKKKRTEQILLEIQELKAAPLEKPYALQIAELEAQKALPPSIDEALMRIKEKRAELQKTVLGLTENINRLTFDKGRAQAQKEQYINFIEQIKIVSTAQNKRCVISDKIACDKDFSKALEAFTGKAKETENEIKKCDDLLTSTLTALKESEEDLRSLDSSEKVLHNSVQKNIEYNRKIELEINQIAHEQRLFEEQNANRLKSLKQYQDELFALEKTTLEAAEPDELLMMRKLGIESQIQELKQKIASEENAKITYSNQQATMVDAKTAEIYKENLKYFLDVAGPKGLQGELLKSQLSGIYSKINENLRLLGIDYDFYFQTESEKKKEIFQFGWVRDNAKIDFSALSGAEQIILMVSLLVAFIEIKQPKIKVLIIDNIDRIHSKNLSRLLSGLLKIKQKLDNIILAGALDPIDVQGWNMIALEGGLYGPDQAEQRTA